MNILLWVGQIILCIKFLSVAFTHAFGRDKAEMQRAMEKIGPIAPPLLILDAVGMFVGSLGLVLPVVSASLGWLAPWAALLLAAQILFSIGFHVYARESPKVWVSLILFALAALVAYGRWVIAPL